VFQTPEMSFPQLAQNFAPCDIGSRHFGQALVVDGVTELSSHHSSAG
jgi:hypothetical protein